MGSTKISFASSPRSATSIWFTCIDSVALFGAAHSIVQSAPRTTPKEASLSLIAWFVKWIEVIL